MCPRFPHADSEDTDQTGRMPRLICVFAGRTCYFVGFVMRDSYLFQPLCFEMMKYIFVLLHGNVKGIPLSTTTAGMCHENVYLFFVC